MSSPHGNGSNASPRTRCAPDLWDVAVNIGTKQVNDESVQPWWLKRDCDSLLLGSRLVICLRSWREVIIDLDPAAVLVSAPGMHSQPLELEEDLDVMLGELQPQLFTAMNVRGAVIGGLNSDVAVRVDCV